MFKRLGGYGRLGCLFALVTGAGLQAQSPLLTSGFYGGHMMQLVVANDGTFTGSFYDEHGAGRDSCGFLIHGDGKHSKRGVYSIVTWWPTTQLDGGKDDEVVNGTLRIEARGITLQLPKRAHAGCWEVDRALAAGVPVELLRAEQQSLWKELRVVKAKHAVLRSQPDAAAEVNTPLDQGDIVTVVATRGEWQHISFYSYTAAKIFTGWVREPELLPIDVPEKGDKGAATE